VSGVTGRRLLRRRGVSQLTADRGLFGLARTFFLSSSSLSHFFPNGWVTKKLRFDLSGKEE
jgi:hypothetical protein